VAVAVDGVAAAYSATGGAWEHGPGPIYNRLAADVVARCPVPLAGALVLDLGAGTGAASRAVAHGGGRAVAVDAAEGMLRHERARRPPGAAGDATRLPFRGAAFDAVIAAFSLNHLPDPVAGCREAARVTRAGGAVVASAYAEDDSHPVKVAVEEAAEEAGWTMPAWYAAVRDEATPLLATTRLAEAAADAAGLGSVRAEAVRVCFDDLDAGALVRWRLGMAYLAPFIATLPASTAQWVAARAEELLGDGPPLTRSFVVVSGVVP
jgi:SAM-dependent methyltransferase